MYPKSIPLPLSQVRRVLGGVLALDNGLWKCLRPNRKHQHGAFAVSPATSHTADVAGAGGDPDSADDRRRDAEPSHQDVVVPDDPSELELDIRAWHRDRVASARRARFDRLVRTRRWRRYGMSGPLTVGVLALVAVFGGLLALLVPTGARDRAARRPLDPAAPSPAGTIGGLLADRPVQITGVLRPARDLRPAVLVLLPARCGCAGLVDELSGQAAEFGLRLVLVAPAGSDPELPRLVSSARHGPVVAAYDEDGRLGRDYAARGPTLILVRDDGRVTGVEREARAGRHRESVLRQLVTTDR